MSENTHTVVQGFMDQIPDLRRVLPMETTPAAFGAALLRDAATEAGRPELNQAATWLEFVESKFGDNERFHSKWSGELVVLYLLCLDGPKRKQVMDMLNRVEQITNEAAAKHKAANNKK